MSSLQVKNLSVSYDRKNDILKEITMDFKEGNCVGVLGANGSGKSTLFRSIVGLLKPSQGEVYYDNRLLKYNKKALLEFRHHVGIVFQDPDQQIFYSIVEDDVAFALKNLKVSPEEIEQRLDKAFDLLNLQELRHKPIQYLSYGQKKKVAIASVLVLNTDWILLDEPTAGLDPVGKRQMMTIIRRLIQRGQNVIISSHDMDLMYDICDYLYVLHGGKILIQGDKKEVFLDNKKLLQADLEQPWLVKMHQHLGLPLYANEAEFLQEKA